MPRGRAAPPARGGARLRVLFVVRGGGRGYAAQALALAAMLRRRGHTVAGALVGVDRWGDAPEFFRRGLGAPVEAIESVGLGADARAVGRGLDRITAALDRAEPDVVVNVYEGLMGAHALLRGVDVPTVAVGRPFMTSVPGRSSGGPARRLAARARAAFVGAGAAERLALSFYDAHRDGVCVTPPLLGDDLFALAGRPRDGSVLVHLADARAAPALAAWSDRRPDVRLRVFGPVAPHAHSAALTFHGLSGRAFVRRMAVARAVVCTAGFDTVSEALWLGTPALLVPAPGQQRDAADAAAVGAGLVSDTLDLDPFLDYLDGPRPDARAATARFRQWVACAEGRAVGAVERAAGLAPARDAAGGDGLAEPADVGVLSLGAPGVG